MAAVPTALFRRAVCDVIHLSCRLSQHLLSMWCLVHAHPCDARAIDPMVWRGDAQRIACCVERRCVVYGPVETSEESMSYVDCVCCIGARREF